LALGDKKTDAEVEGFGIPTEKMDSTTTVNEVLERTVYQMVADVLRHYVCVVIATTGIGCNVLSLTTHSHPNMRQHSTSVYFGSLAVVDSLCLISFVIYLWMPHEPVCHLIGMLLSCTTTLSAFIVVIVTAERALVVYFPLKSKAWQLRRWAVGLVATAAVASYTMYIPRAFSRSPTLHCTPGAKYIKVFFIQYALFYMAAPIVLLFLLNAAIIFRLRIAHHMFTDNPESASTASGSDVRKASSVAMAISTAYILLNLPSIAGLCYEQLHGGMPFGSDKKMIWEVVIALLGMTNHASNFFLYVLVSSKFRNILKAWLGLIVATLYSPRQNENSTVATNLSDQAENAI
jgi:growth hormone secretagogue receptor